MKPRRLTKEEKIALISAASAIIVAIVTSVVAPLVISLFGHNTSGPSQEGTTVHGCRPEFACIYPRDADWNGDQPERTYYKYGTYKLANGKGDPTGDHIVFNNQTGDARFWLCTDENGSNCDTQYPPGQGVHEDLTRYKSVKLTKYLNPIARADPGEAGGK
jgi:hypothetical protein